MSKTRRRGVETIPIGVYLIAVQTMATHTGERPRFVYYTTMKLQRSNKGDLDRDKVVPCIPFIALDTLHMKDVCWTDTTRDTKAPLWPLPNLTQPARLLLVAANSPISFNNPFYTCPWPPEAAGS